MPLNGDAMSAFRLFQDKSRIQTQIFTRWGDLNITTGLTDFSQLLTCWIWIRHSFSHSSSWFPCWPCRQWSHINSLLIQPNCPRWIMKCVFIWFISHGGARGHASVKKNIVHRQCRWTVIRITTSARETEDYSIRGGRYVSVIKVPKRPTKASGMTMSIYFTLNLQTFWQNTFAWHRTIPRYFFECNKPNIFTLHPQIKIDKRSTKSTAPVRW